MAIVTLDRPGLGPAAALLATLALSALWAGVDLYSHRNDFPRPARIPRGATPCR